MPKRPLRILMIHDHITFGGGGAAVFNLERLGYEEAGHHVYTFSKAEDIPNWVTDRDFVVQESKSRLIRKLGKFVASPHISRALRHVLNKVRPHFVSVHLISKYPLGIYGPLANFPAVQTLHGPNLFCASSWGCLKNGAPCEMGIGLKCYMRGCSSLTEATLYTGIARRYTPQLKQNINLFVCPSYHIQDSAESLGLQPTTFVPLGIDACFQTIEPSLHQGPLVILFVGSLIREKGIHVLLEAFAKVHASIPEATLQIAGRGHLAEKLSADAVALGIADSVKFLGFVDHKEIHLLFKQASVFVMPSVYKEQFGLAGPEALACGIPCVGSNFGGIPEWLHDGKWGFTVPHNDAQALADKLTVLLRDPKLRLDFGHRGRAYALEQYHPDKYKLNRLRIAEEYGYGQVKTAP